MRKRDLLTVVEAAYDCDGPTDAWLARAARELLSTLPGVVTPIAYTLSFDEHGKVCFPNAFMEGVPDARAVLTRAHADLQPEHARIIFPAGTHSVLFSERLAEIRQAGLSVPESVMSNAGGAGDILGILHVTADGHGIVIGALVREVRLTPRAREAHRRVAVHLAAGLRLRSVLAPSSDPLVRAEAIFETDGRIAHASGAAAPKPARARLHEAVAAVERARTDQRLEELEALELWRGLVAGRWSLFDRVDHDGRRYYVATPNPPHGLESRQLTTTESRVVALVVAGEPNKVIAYALGVEASTVAGVLARAMRKLGARSRIDLIRIGKKLVAGPASV